MSVEAGRDAFRKSHWAEAYQALSEAGGEGSLGPDDLDALGKSAYCTGHLDDAIRAYERAFTGYIEAGNRRAAAMVAMWGISSAYWNKGMGGLGDAWDQRALRVLEGEPDCVEHGWMAFGMGDTDRALEFARRFGDRTLEAKCLHRKGRALIAAGKVNEGMALIDDVCATIAAGETRPYDACLMYCATIGTCEDLGDYRRAREWWDIAHPYYLGFGPNVFPGICRVHRAGIMKIHGSWDEAEQEAMGAIEAMRGFNAETLGLAFRELGDIRLRRGDLPAAEAAYLQAHEAGVGPQPGLALLRLAQGKRESALRLIKAAIEDRRDDRLEQARALLPALVAISIEAGDFGVARSAADQLEAAAAEYGTTALLATAARARGMVQLVDGEMAQAVTTLRRAHQLWRDVDAPYEAARTRLLLGRAYLAQGDAESAMLELEAARPTFARLGAQLDIQEVEGLIRRASVVTPDGPPAHRTFMFTDIVGSTALIDALGDDAWGNLLRWHDESLRACMAAHHGEEVDHAGDGFLVAFPDQRSAIECAISIQRNLAGHRLAHGFSPQIRIGLHATVATLTGGKYAGKGVHIAARIGAVAAAGEILSSSSTVVGMDGLEMSQPRALNLKGIAEPVDVVSIGWR